MRTRPTKHSESDDIDFTMYSNKNTYTEFPAKHRYSSGGTNNSSYLEEKYGGTGLEGV